MPRYEWKSGDSYDYYMGRWSRLVAKRFLEWLSPARGLKWLDVGCGSGVLSTEIISQYNPAKVVAVDQSEGFVNALRVILDEQAQCLVGNALALPVEAESADIVVSGLVLNFIAEPLNALAEMKRATARGGTVAVYVWDYSGTMDFLNKFWDMAVTLDPSARSLHEGTRFRDSNIEALTGLFEASGFTEIASTPIQITTLFNDFDDFWNPFLGGQGPAPTYLMSLDDAQRTRLRTLLVESLPIRSDGSISMNARAWAIRGNVTR